MKKLQRQQEICNKQYRPGSSQHGHSASRTDDLDLNLSPAGVGQPDGELDMLHDEQTQALDVPLGHSVGDGQRSAPALGDLPLTALVWTRWRERGEGKGKVVVRGEDVVSQKWS